MSRTRHTGFRILSTTAAMVGVLLVAACEGENLFSVPGQGSRNSGEDSEAPVVKINSPRGDSLSAKPVGDSVFISAQVTDDVGVRSISFRGISFRGDPNLGTDTVVERFNEKIVTLPDPVDTTITRYILPTPDSVKETVQIVVTATDTLGNVATDTVDLILGGPDVQLLDIEEGGVVQAGLNLSARVVAQDPLGITQIRIDVTGAFEASVVRGISPPSDSAAMDTVIAIPAGVTGEIQVSAVARNNLDVAGQDGPVGLTVIAAGVGDTAAPNLKHTASAPTRMELQDMVTLQVSGSDDAQGGGVSAVGYTVYAISPTRSDTLVRSDSAVFTPPRTGTVSTNFQFPVFNVDSLTLPDTLLFEINSWMRDADGNCAAAIGADSLASLPCAIAGTATVAANRAGQRVTRPIVAGRTVLLPSGGLIMDAVVDTLRRNLFLSNIDQGRVEVFRLQQENFLTSIPVGSQPWGMTLNNCAPLSPAAGCGDTLIVGNSGGTNLSMVYLGPSDGLGPAAEDSGRRLLTPDVILFDVEEVIDESASLRYSITVHPDPDGASFSDRPQYVARDSTGRILYSTKVVESLDQVGTIRKAFHPAGQPQPEVKLFVEHAELDEADDFTAIAHIDDINVFLTATDDNVVLVDHVPGDVTNVILSTQDVLGNAIADILTKGSDIYAVSARKWNIPNVGFTDTTLVAASGDGGWVVFGEGAIEPVGRVIMYEASQDRISSWIEVSDLITNAGETVRGLGLNYDGTLGVVRGTNQVSFFTTDLRLQGGPELSLSGGAGAVLHPLHANQKSVRGNLTGDYRPDTHLAFVGTGEGTIDIYDTFHFFRSGRIWIRDVVNGPLRASLPFPEDNQDPAGVPFQCISSPVTDQAGRVIGSATEIFQGGNFENPWPADGGAGGTEDRCVVLKLYGTTDAGGVVVIDVRKSDILRDHPSRQ